MHCTDTSLSYDSHLSHTSNQIFSVFAPSGSCPSQNLGPYLFYLDRPYKSLLPRWLPAAGHLRAHCVKETCRCSNLVEDTASSTQAICTLCLAFSESRCLSILLNRRKPVRRASIYAPCPPLAGDAFRSFQAARLQQCLPCPSRLAGRAWLPARGRERLTRLAKRPPRPTPTRTCVPFTNALPLPHHLSCSLSLYLTPVALVKVRSLLTA